MSENWITDAFNNNVKLLNISIVCACVVAVVSLAACMALFMVGLWWQPVVSAVFGLFFTSLVLNGWKVRTTTKKEE